jgi:hypothetical protein
VIAPSTVSGPRWFKSVGGVSNTVGRRQCGCTGKGIIRYSRSAFDWSAVKVITEGALAE